MAFARYPNLMLALAMLVARHWPALVHSRLCDRSPRTITFTTAPMWKSAVDWVKLHFFDAIEAVRVGVLIYVLNPLRALFEGLPWLGVVLIARLCRLSPRRMAAGSDRRRCLPLSAP